MNSTWNPWHGCHKISAGCEHCYMYALDKYHQQDGWSDKIFKTGNFKKPLSKYRDGRYKVPAGSFLRVNMTSDTFLQEADPWRDEFWEIIKARPDVKFWILTKRADRIAQCLPPDWGQGYPNVSLNVTVENQDNVRRAEILKNIPAAHRGICCAPLIGPVNLGGLLTAGAFEFVEAGGENYDNPRPCDFSWALSLSQQCEAAHVNFCWYETGTYLIKDGVQWTFPRKSDQSAQAYLSRINRKFYDIQWELRDPNDGHLLQPNELRPLVYNLHNCQFCANRQACNGCTSCGHCHKPIELTDAAGIRQAELRQAPGFIPSVP